MPGAPGPTAHRPRAKDAASRAAKTAGVRLHCLLGDAGLLVRWAGLVAINLPKPYML